MSTPERRIGPRRPVVIRQVRLEASQEIFFGYATNFSTGGLYIQTSNPKPFGSQFLLHFNLPGDSHTIECRGEVVWRREFHSESSPRAGMGIRFLDLGPEDADRIRAFKEADPGSIIVTRYPEE